jgi:hypothetical protein
MPIRTLATGAAQSLFHLVFGAATAPQLRLPLAVALVGLLGGGLLALTRRTTFFVPARQFSPRITGPRIVLAATLIYAAGIAAIALRSVISYEARMYIPVLPHMICLSVLGLGFMIRGLPGRGRPRAVGLGIIACLSLGYGAANFISRGTLTADGFERTREALLQPDGAGLSILRRLSGELESGETIAATNGQIAGYVLDHPTLSLVGRPYSLVTWDERALRAEMTRYGARHLLLFRDAGIDPVVRQSRFLGDLANGHTVPWLRPVAFNRDVSVYRVQ